MVAIPATLEAAGDAKFCSSFLKPSEVMMMTVSLKSKELDTTLMQIISNKEFHYCTDFKVRRKVELRARLPELQRRKASVCRRFLTSRKTR